MIVLQGVVFLLAATSALALAAAVLAQRGPRSVHWSFAAGMVGFAVEQIAGFMLATVTETPADHLLWLRISAVAGLLLTVPWTVFVAALCHPGAERIGFGWRLALGALCALGLAGGVAVLLWPSFELFDAPGRFLAARLSVIGHAASVVRLLATVGILAALEGCLRRSRGTTRWRLKYLLLGLGGIFLVRFYLLSHELLFKVVMVDYLTTGAVTLFVGNLLVGASLARGRLAIADLTVSRQLVYRSMVVGVLGCYLLVIGALGWLLNTLGIRQELFWGSLVVFVSALGLAAILLSGEVRRRVKRFVGLHFYRSKYDYQEQWSRFTKRLGSRLTLEALAPELVNAACEAVGATSSALYLADERDGRYHLVAAAGTRGLPARLAAESPLLARVRAEQTPVRLGNGGGTLERLGGRALAETLPDAVVAVPLPWQGRLTGVMLLGPERTGATYVPEDFEFLATVGEQAAGALVTAQLSERLVQSREFEAFNRLTTFVVHDLKNSISALSMLSQNALAHFDDPEFQRDAVRTLSRTVDRMKALLSRLSATPVPDSAQRQLEVVDLVALVHAATDPLAKNPKVSLVTDLAPVDAVRGDRDALLRVIQNLVTNAGEALNGEGIVTVRTYEDQGWTVVSVADTGSGIPEEFLRNSLFVPFRSTKKGGWGIGLYQSKLIVEAHGGTMEVASKLGEGTTFWVRLPVKHSRKGVASA
ncbi:MAG: PEP-CTERM system histidine kinase PrsK [Candidatus Rokubacteria bacterium]|nr:PEP-CTERM system histidine kinase PrsK [Candidatus Rokubacteria bacterium]